MADLMSVLESQRRAFVVDGPPSAAVRRRRIDRLLAALIGHSDQFADAMAADFGTRSPNVSMMNDIIGSVADIEHSRANLHRWMKPKKLNRWTRPGLRADLQPDPLGVIGIIAPWNFPLNLAVVPAAAAFAAGNRVMIKMSEKTPRTADLFATVMADSFSPEELIVATGGRDVGDEFSRLPFDHLFFTGSPEVGRHVMARAAANLVPVTLELGGKNPAVIAPDADPARAAQRIMAARLSNGGQICLCPDYVLVPAGHAQEVTAHLVQAAERLHPHIQDDPQYCSLIDAAAYARVVALVDDARSQGATVTQSPTHCRNLPDPSTRKVIPTILGKVTESMLVDSEEIFGPVLAVHEYESIDGAIEFVNSRPSPLAAYWYGAASPAFERFVRQTRSGGVSRNDFALHGAFSSAPFGGVGRSGMGAYHGKFGFDTFSHLKPVVGIDLPFPLTTSPLPFGERAGKTLQLALRGYSKLLARRLHK